jgi:RecB family exonuclease
MSVGTPAELVDLLRRNCLVFLPESKWREALEAAAASVPSAFWLRSLDADRPGTLDALSQALTSLLTWAGPDGITLARLEGAPARLAERVGQLIQLHRAMGGILPDDLAVRKALIDVPQDQVLCRVQVDDHLCPTDLDPWTQAVIERQDSMDAELSGHLAKRLESVFSPEPQAEDRAGSLCLLQQDLFMPSSVGQRPLDDSVACVSVRDALEEVEVAAQTIRTALEADPGLSPRDFGMVLPDEQHYHQFVLEVFAEVGIPVGKLDVSKRTRAFGTEAVNLFIQAMRKPAAPMAIASLCLLPVMPWDEETGRALAAKAMERHKAPTAPEGLSEDGEWLLKKLHFGADSVDELRKALGGMTRLAARVKDCGARKQMEQALAVSLKLLAGKKEIPWEELVRATTSEPTVEEGESDAFQGAVAVFSEHREPWRKVKHLFVLGFSEGRYPSGGGNSPVFTQAELAWLDEAGIGIPTEADVRREGQSLLRTRINMTTRRVVFLVPAFDLAGERIFPSDSLSWIASLFFADADADKLLRSVDRADDVKSVPWLKMPTASKPEASFEPEKKDLELGRDLLSEGHQSPTTLDTLLVSPLAWLLGDNDMLPDEWGPVDLDVKTQGTLAHAVFEKLFAADQALPEKNQIADRVPALLEEAVRKIAPPLQADEFRMQLRQLATQLARAALTWCALLESIGARVLATEFRLAGDLDGLPIKGKADTALQLADGTVFITDYKKSSSSNRRKRMEHGMDIQVALYKAMLAENVPEEAGDGLRQALERKGEVGVLYYLLNDAAALVAGIQTDEVRDAGMEPVDDQDAAPGIDLLKQRFAQLRNGLVRLDRPSELEALDKAGVPAKYAAGASPLLAMFQLRDEAADGEETP